MSIVEWGDVVALRPTGARASAPRFVPLPQSNGSAAAALDDLRQDAHGLAGAQQVPGKALVSAIVSVISAQWIAVSSTQLRVQSNRSSLLPFWQLDGKGAFRVFTRSQRWLATTSVAIALAPAVTPTPVNGRMAATGVGVSIARGAARSIALEMTEGP
jgi:hypothetical protein